jgi:hypothetical protein
LEYLKRYLILNGKTKIFEIVKDAKCDLKFSSTYSQKLEAIDKSIKRRWDAFGAEITFHVPVYDEESKITDEVKLALLRCCNECLEEERGYDILDIKFMPLLEDQSPIADLKRTISDLSADFLNIVMSPDMKRKGRLMAEVYLYLYYVENSLRFFIGNVSKSKFGDDYFEHLNLNKEIKHVLKKRKAKEENNKWLGLRGNSDLFYLDFGHLSVIIRNNPDIFKNYFPNDHWLKVKIDELKECRNLVAHNSFVDDHTRDVIKTNYISILKQIAEKE